MKRRIKKWLKHLWIYGWGYRAGYQDGNRAKTKRRITHAVIPAPELVLLKHDEKIVKQEEEPEMKRPPRKTRKQKIAESKLTKQQEQAQPQIDLGAHNTEGDDTLIKPQEA